MLTKAIIFTVLVLSSLASAAPQKYNLNTQHSFVNFTIPFMKVSKVNGSFKDFHSNFKYDPVTGKIESILAEIEVSSISTNDKKRDQHLQTNDFFDSENYPQMRFESTRSLYDNNGELEAIEGNLQIKDVVKKVTLFAKMKGAKRDVKNYESLFVELKGKINREDFLLGWNKPLERQEYLLGNTIDIEIVVEAQKEGSKPPFSRFYKKGREDHNRTKELKQKSRPSIESPLVQVAKLKKENALLQKRIEDLEYSISELKQVKDAQGSKIQFLKGEKDHKYENEGLSTRGYIVMTIIGLFAIAAIVGFSIWMRMKLFAKYGTTKKRNLIIEIICDLTLLGMITVLSYFSYVAIYGQGVG